MKKFIHAEKNQWFTQAELKRGQLRVFLKLVLTDKLEKWVTWDDEQRKEYQKKHKFHSN